MAAIFFRIVIIAVDFQYFHGILLGNWKEKCEVNNAQINYRDILADDSNRLSVITSIHTVTGTIDPSFTLLLVNNFLLT